MANPIRGTVPYGSLPRETDEVPNYCSISPKAKQRVAAVSMFCSCVITMVGAVFSFQSDSSCDINCQVGVPMTITGLVGIAASFIKLRQYSGI